MGGWRRTRLSRHRASRINRRRRRGRALPSWNFERRWWPEAAACNGCRGGKCGERTNGAAREPNYDAIVAGLSIRSTSQAARLMSNAYGLPRCPVHYVIAGNQRIWWTVTTCALALSLLRCRSGEFTGRPNFSFGFGTRTVSKLFRCGFRFTRCTPPVVWRPLSTELPAIIRISLILLATRVTGLNRRCWKCAYIFIHIFLLGSENACILKHSA